MDNIHPGLHGEQVVTVSEPLTALYMGSGSLEVYATPAMIALMEAAAVNAIDHLLPEGQSSVGIALNVKHISATLPGEEVRAQAEVIDVNGRRVIFEVRAWDEHDLIGEGTHTRYVVDVDRFLSRLESGDPD
jgi:fluoroacetyl-CoA thioesterase